MSSLAPSVHRVARLLAATAITVGLLGVAGPTAAAEPIVIRLQLDGRCIIGNLPDGASATVTVKRPRAATLSKTAQTASTDFSACFSRTFRPGDRITVDAGVAKRTVTIPRLTGVLDRVKNAVAGHAPTTGTLLATGHACIPSECTNDDLGPLTVAAGGTFRRTFDGTDVDGLDHLNLQLDTPAGDSFQLEVWAATLRASGGARTKVDVLPARSGPVTVTLRSASGKVRATAKATLRADGRYHRLTLRKNGKPVRMAIGDRLTSSIAADVNLKVVSLTVTGDATEDVIRGTCTKDALIRFSVKRGGLTSDAPGTADASGVIAFVTVLESGDGLQADCADPHGDVLRLTGAVP